MRKYIDIISLNKSRNESKVSSPKITLNESVCEESNCEVSEKTYTVEQQGEEFHVYQHDVYPDNSVLAGECRKRYVDSFPTKEAACEHYPSCDEPKLAQGISYEDIMSYDAGQISDFSTAKVDELEENDGLQMLYNETVDDLELDDPDLLDTDEDAELFSDIDNQYGRALDELDNFSYSKSYDEEDNVVIIESDDRNRKFKSDEEELAAVKKNGLDIQYVNPQSEEIQKEAVKQNGLALMYIINPSEDIQQLAVKQNGLAVRHIEHPTDEVIRLACEQNPEACSESITLDAAPARIRFNDNYAFVSRRDGKGGDVEYSKKAAFKIIANGGNFVS